MRRLFAPWVLEEPLPEPAKPKTYEEVCQCALDTVEELLKQGEGWNQGNDSHESDKITHEATGCKLGEYKKDGVIIYRPRMTVGGPQEIRMRRYLDMILDRKRECEREEEKERLKAEVLKVFPQCGD